MILELSRDAADAMLNELARLMDGGTIELMSDQRVLAVLKLASPAAMAAVDGELELNTIIGEDAALARGNALSARILGATGDEIFSCDVGDENSDAVIKLVGTTTIHRGQPVGLSSFRLVMP